MATEAQRILSIHDILTTAYGMPEVVEWENDDAQGKRVVPRLEYTIGRAPPVSSDLSGAPSREMELRTVLVIDAGDGLDACIAFGEAMRQAFPVTSRIADMTVMAAAYEPGGLKDDDEFRWPVIIRLRAVE